MKRDVSISKLYTAVLNAYVTTHQEDIMATLDRVYGDESSTLDPDLMKIQVALLEGEAW